MIEVYTDGAALPTNPGPAGAGAVGYRDGKVLFEVATTCGIATNNVAEYTAAITGMALAVALMTPADDIVLRTDSKLVVEQYNWRWRCRNAALEKLLHRLHSLGEPVQARVEWIPREVNERADELSRMGVVVG